MPSAAVLVVGALLIWPLLRATPLDDLSPVALTSYPGFETQPSFSPDGSKVTFAWNDEQEDNYDVYVKQIGSGGPPMRLTTSALPEFSPAWSPDDRWIAFLRQQKQKNNQAVVLVSPLGGVERTLAEAATVAGLSWTPDAKWLVVGARDSATEPLSLWEISVETGERRRLTNPPPKPLTADLLLGDAVPSVSPDGRTLAFRRGVGSYVCELYVLRLMRDLQPDGEPRLLVNQRYAMLPGIAWTADSREVVHAAGGIDVQSLWRVPVSGREAPRRVPYALPAAHFPAIARTTPRLAYGWRVLNQNIWRLDVLTGERKTLIGSTYDSRIADYSPDGRKIAFQSNRSGNLEVWTCDADGSNCAQLTSFNGPQCGSPRWSPDSRWPALDSRSEGQPAIYVMAADGGKPRRLTDHAADDMLPSWSADGGWVHFASNRSGRFELWKVPKDGGDPTQITRTGGLLAHASADGRYIYFTKLSSPPSLSRMLAEGGEETQVLPAFGGAFDVTATGLHFFAPGARTISRLDLATGKISTVATLDRAGNMLTASPDDAFLVWDQRDRDTCDLMLVEGFR